MTTAWMQEVEQRREQLPRVRAERAKGEGDWPSSPSLLPQGEGGEPRRALGRALLFFEREARRGALGARSAD
jgi:hypothetical protein